MTMNRLFTAAVLAFAAATAIAHDGMHGPGAEFDADQDGKLSVEEYSAYLEASKQDVTTAAAMFAKLDRDQNGFLSSAEFIAGLPKADKKNP